MTGYKTEWVEEDRQRVLKMDQLFLLDGRHRKDHPKASTYSGLWQEYQIYQKWKDQLDGIEV